MKNQNSRWVWKGQKELRTGYTTGSCAAAAAKAAVGMLLSGEEIRHVSLMTPKGIRLYLDVEEITREKDSVRCAVRKDSGDDPDVTNGILVFAEVRKTQEKGISLDGGEGVGRVTRKGLEQKIGEAAINKVPRRIIMESVQEQIEAFQYEGGITVVIEVPKGQELAAKTFNPRLGIEGGISILGTSGIVEPMSEQALTETIYAEMRMLKENGCEYCYIVPGNYGSDFLRESLGFREELAVKCSNYIGFVLDDAVNLKMKGILLIGHIGKLVKVAAGVMNTHSRQADCRMEVLAAHAAMTGAEKEVICKIMECITTTEALEILKQQGILKEVMSGVLEKILFYLRNRTGGQIETEVVLFSLEEGILARSSGVEKLAAMIERQWNPSGREEEK